jgi:hypothetical protein
MKITQTNNRYVVETEAGRLHILNEKSLRWNLKHVLRLTPKQVKVVVWELENIGEVIIELIAAA